MVLLLGIMMLVTFICGLIKVLWGWDILYPAFTLLIILNGAYWYARANRVERMWERFLVSRSQRDIHSIKVYWHPYRGIATRVDVSIKYIRKKYIWFGPEVEDIRRWAFVGDDAIDIMSTLMRNGYDPYQYQSYSSSKG